MLFRVVVVVGGYVLKWIHLKRKPQWILKAVPVVIEKVWGMQEGFVEGSTEIVTDSHRTVCANDTFHSVSLQYSGLFLPEGFSHV